MAGHLILWARSKTIPSSTSLFHRRSQAPSLGQGGSLFDEENNNVKGYK